jgi:tRNA G18 (ribose-2'-O)-methylase SpoU
VIQRIADASHPVLAPYRHVGDPAALERRGLFVAEGRFVVERLIAARPRFSIESIVVTPAAAAALAEVLDRAGDIPVIVCEPPLLERITGFDFHRGCLALARRPSATPLTSFARARRLLALERVGNPDNVGGLFRVALALGGDGVLLDPASGDPLYRKAIRTSMGAALRVPFARVEPWPAGLDEVRGDAHVVALTPDLATMPIDEYAVEPDRRLILLLGSEGPGLSDAAMRYADVRLRIPVAPAADSLNVVVAAGIALHACGFRLQAEDLG